RPSSWPRTTRRSSSAPTAASPCATARWCTTARRPPTRSPASSADRPGPYRRGSGLGGGGERREQLVEHVRDRQRARRVEADDRGVVGSGEGVVGHRGEVLEADELRRVLAPGEHHQEVRVEHRDLLEADLDPAAGATCGVEDGGRDLEAERLEEEAGAVLGIGDDVE